MMKKFEVTFYYTNGNIEAETINNTLLTLLPCESNIKYKVRTHEINKDVYNSLNSECDELREVLWEQLKQNEELTSLVKRMRECQRKIARFVSAVDPISYDEYEASQDVIKLEREVDEYLKRMEI